MSIDLTKEEVQAFEDALIYYRGISGETEVTPDDVNETLRRLGSEMYLNPIEFLVPAIREIAKRWKERVN